jgi:hypothetical protein
MKTFTCMLFGASLATLTLAAGCSSEEVTTGTSGSAGTAGDSGSSGDAGSDSGGSAGAGAAAGTGGSTAGTTGSAGDNGMASDVYPAPHPAPPRIISLGGPVLLSPKIYPVFFANDDPAFTGKVADFVSKVGSTKYWLASVQEYDGVGSAAGMPPILLPEMPSGKLDDTTIQSWLEDKLNSDDPAFPVPDENTIIALFYPLNVTITKLGAQSCIHFGAYHYNITLDAAHGFRTVTYAVMPHCNGFAGTSELDAMTASASHELIEAAINPYPASDPAYARVDDEHYFWLFALGGGENANLCAQSKASFVKLLELPEYMVQRSWSNLSAQAGHDPCVPILPGTVYFNSAPVMPDKITVDIPQPVQMEGIQVPMGESKTIEVVLFSDAKTSGPWNVTAFDTGSFQNNQPELAFTFDKSSGVNGEKLNLTIKRLKESKYGASLFYLVSTLGGQQSLWIGLAGN